ncbi:MAG: AAC(3) family N-acetyltransferase [Firmicutes bacterium]|nr:AAC(3) family N-acetyltransferase [Bacillota bacterium]
MYTKQDLLEHIEAIGVEPEDTLLIHSSMKAIGEVENGADTVLDAFIEYLADGLLIFPTHTWRQMNNEYNVFDVVNEPSCVGILTNLFMKRPGVIRSWHPTHSVAALGRDAAQYTAGEERFDTPCPREGCWGKLYDRDAKILFLGASTTRNTIIHGVEEWANIPNRLTEGHQYFKILTPDGRLIDRPMKRHSSPVPDISQHYGKLEEPLLHIGAAKKGKIGDAVSVLIEVVPMVDLTMEFLRRDPDLFIDNEPIPKEWY